MQILQEDSNDYLRLNPTSSGPPKTKILVAVLVFVLVVVVLGLIIGLTAPKGSADGSISDVRTTNAVGQIGESVILGCTFTPDGKQSSNILWEQVGQTGAVYKYENGEASLVDQNLNFRGRTSLFVDQISAGNASLKINNLQMRDAGAYKCTITNSRGKEGGGLSLTVGVFTTLSITSISRTTLRCSSPNWYPKPRVSWLNATSGDDLTGASSTTYEPGLSGMVKVISDLSGIKEEEHYKCVIQNKLARGVGEAVMTASGLKTTVRLTVTESAAKTLSPPLHLLCPLLLLHHLIYGK